MSEDKITEIESKYKENIEDKVSGFIISVPDYQFLLSENAALRAELAEKEREIERITRIHKADMENMFQRFEIAANAAIKQVARAEKAESENAALRERLKGVEYQKHEFCKDVECGEFDNGRCHARQCYRTAKHFHRWLKQNGYKIIKSVCKKGE